MQFSSPEGEAAFEAELARFRAVRNLFKIARLEKDNSGMSIQEPDGLKNLHAILEDQPHLNSPLSVVEIKTILQNEGGFMPNEAVIWFREWRVARP